MSADPLPDHMTGYGDPYAVAIGTVFTLPSGMTVRVLGKFPDGVSAAVLVADGGASTGGLFLPWAVVISALEADHG